MIKLKELLEEATISMGQVHSNPYATSFKSPEQIVKEDFWATPPGFSNPEAKLHLDADIKKMSKILGKSSQQIIKIMMDGVKGGRYGALDIQRSMQTGLVNRTHTGEIPFMQMLWRKVRDGFRRYSKVGKLRK